MSVFLAESGQLLVVSERGRVLYRGNPLSAQVIQAIGTHDGTSAIVLFDHQSWGARLKHNLACVDERGNVQWQAYDPEGALSGDPIVSVQTVTDMLRVNTWGGWRCSVDMHDGQMRIISCTK